MADANLTFALPRRKTLRKGINMKKTAAVFLVILVFCSGCSGKQNEGNQKAESQTAMNQVEAESIMPEKDNEEDIKEDGVAENASASAETIDYGTTGNDFLNSAPVSGMVISLTESGFVTGEAFASEGSSDNSTTNVVYDKDTVRFKTALVKADGSSFSVEDGQPGDVVERAIVQVYGNEQEDGTFQATEIIVVKFDYGE